MLIVDQLYQMRPSISSPSFLNDTIALSKTETNLDQIIFPHGKKMFLYQIDSAV